jgi:hypothetical protein
VDFDVLQELKTQPDRKNDVNWCMQYLSIAFGMVFLVIGTCVTTGFLANLKDFYLIYFGFFWLLIGYVHRLKWLHKRDLREALEPK